NEPIQSINLMERASIQLVDWIMNTIDKKQEIYCFIGPGNNGGDGLVVARHLFIHNIRPKVFVLASKDKLKGDAAINCKIFQKMKGAVKFLAPSVAELKKADLVVDAIFGIGLNRKISGIFKEVIEDINKSAKKVFSLDIPSGLDADTGKIHGICIKAKKTITFYSAKKGMFLRDGKNNTGISIVTHIGCQFCDCGI
ncbi:MAG: NAD(P)H-hydrate epimerase, partial [Candidatus Heimdallarchaeota archaeon]|nr:NAD(P)H-hydrate epimerase [Candidatus Heimdallarchaeota archaeon]